MAIKQIIEFKSDHKYFAGFLQNLIDTNDIKGSVSFEKKHIELILDDSDLKKLQNFGDDCEKYLPNSIFLGAIQTSTTKDQIKNEKFHSPFYHIAPCPQCIEAITNPASDDYLNNSYQCTHYTNDIQSPQDTSSYSVHYSKGMTLLLTNSAKAAELFYLSQMEQKALFSIEKPSIKVTIKDERLKEIVGGKHFIYIRAPFDIQSTLVALNAKESEIDYLFFDEYDHKKAVIVKDNISFIQDNNVTKTLENLHDDKALNRVLNLEKEAGFKGSISAYMSRFDGINCIVSNEVGIKKVLKVQNFDIQNLLEDFQNDPLKSKLYENFSKQYPQVIEKLKSSDSLDIFETLYIILELNTNASLEESKAFEALSDKGYEFRGNGGVKIDMYFKDDGFDYVSFFGSIMSFKLANTQTHFLAFSIFEAFGDMIINILNQLQKQFKIDNFIMIGDMFENSVLYSRILNKFQLQKPYFPVNIALDEAVEI